MKPYVFLKRVLVSAILLGATQAATAQNYPAKQIHLIVAYTPGGAVDAVARRLATSLSESFGQQVVVENRPGASGNIGGEFVVKSPADGYTLLFAPSTLIANPLVMKGKPPFDVNRDLTPVTMVASGPLLMVVNPAGPSSVSDFVAKAKATPEKFSFGTGGFGAAGHLSAEYFKLRSGINNVPVVLYKGTAPALTDIIGGQLSAMMEPTLSAMSFVRAGKLRALAISGNKRDPLFPEVPTFAEAGYSDMEFATWYGVWGPAKLPADVVRKLAEASKAALEAPDFRAWLAERGYEGSPLTGTAFTGFLDKEAQRYARIVSEGKIQPE